jgi:hypothetical protein
MIERLPILCIQMLTKREPACDPRDEESGRHRRLVLWTWSPGVRGLLALLIVASAVGLLRAHRSLGTVSHGGATRAATVPLVDINTAPRQLLEALPHVGPSLVKRVLEQREIQPFTSPQDLRRVRGIGPATQSRLAPYLKFADQAKTGQASDESRISSLSVEPRRVH